MNYARDIIISLRQNGREEKELKFVVAKSYSPYMELSDAYINFDKVEEEIEVNPYYRYYEVFKDLFNVNNEEDVELRETFFDIVMHFIANGDAMSGMTKQEYYLRFVIDDISKGILGDRIKEKFEVFNYNEKIIIAENVVKMYKTGQTLYLLKDTVRRIFVNTTIYANYETSDELLFYMPYVRTEINEAKMDFIKEFFLPIRFRTEIYWEEHFGVIEEDETMKIDSIAIY
ncbi:MAG: iron-dependent peroxidase [Clostridiaceae bacterium]|jgi:hypothetical protein|nr:iron-dependent peroxidase [Clostridiaceae bacterium]NMB95555.1 iron-dependent peroxidase [Clostridiaceae bacterium]